VKLKDDTEVYGVLPFDSLPTFGIHVDPFPEPLIPVKRHREGWRKNINEHQQIGI